MKLAILSAAVLALGVTSAPAFASGSGSGSRGGGFESGSSASNADRQLQRGRAQVRKHITCRKCDYNKRLNDKTAGEVAQAVRQGRFDLNDDDRTAVLYYLRNRYGV